MLCVMYTLRSNNCALGLKSQFAIITCSHLNPVLRYFICGVTQCHVTQMFILPFRSSPLPLEQQMRSLKFYQKSSRSFGSVKRRSVSCDSHVIGDEPSQPLPPLSPPHTRVQVTRVCLYVCVCFVVCVWKIERN